jgi:hypothetical protein
MHSPEKMTLLPVNLCEQGFQPLAVIDPVWPISVLPYVSLIFAFHAVIVVFIRR